jgi:LacI family transcriptional regulator
MYDSELSKKSYRAIALDLIEKIAAGEVKEGSFLPVERNLIQDYGVTRTTVRRALAELVEQGHGRLIPNRGVIAQRKQPPGSKAIGFVAGSGVVVRSIYAKLNSTLMNMGYYLVHIDSQTIGFENALLFAQEHGFIGVFIWSFEGFPDRDLLAKVHETMPIVALDHKLGTFETDLVSFDYLQMGYEAVTHLFKAGRNRVAVSGMLDMLNTTHDRFSGYMKGVLKNDRRLDVRDFAFCFTSGSDLNFDQLRTRLTAADRPDAIFVMQDEFVPGVIDTVLSCGLSVPDDIAIATIGDDLTVNVGGQGITAIHCDWGRFASLAMDLFLMRLRQPEGARVLVSAKHELVPGRFTRDLSPNSQTHSYVVTQLRRPAYKTPVIADAAVAAAALSSRRGSRQSL